MESPARATTIPISKQDLVSIYEQYSPGLYRYAYRLLGDSNQAEEAVSETFSRFLQAIRNGGGPSANIQAYLYRVTHNYITDMYRRQPPQSISLEGEHYVDELSNPVHLATKEFEQERIRKALLQLAPDQRRVIMLRVLEDWSHEEVASALGKTVEATRALQYRALSALRRLLIENEEDSQ
jgi:RNA polymerase sigma-70 factor (ECF subfamily)